MNEQIVSFNIKKNFNIKIQNAIGINVPFAPQFYDTCLLIDNLY